MRLVPELVPLTTWYTNVRSVLSRAEWDVLRREVYRRAGYVCEICGGHGSKHPVECHEVWEHNLKSGVQKLVGMRALCPLCHEVKHIGRASMNGRFDVVCRHMQKVNGCSAQVVSDVVRMAFEKWEMLSKRVWELDLAWLDEFRR